VRLALIHFVVSEDLSDRNSDIIVFSTVESLAWGGCSHRKWWIVAAVLAKHVGFSCNAVSYLSVWRDDSMFEHTLKALDVVFSKQIVADTVTVDQKHVAVLKTMLWVISSRLGVIAGRADLVREIKSFLAFLRFVVLLQIVDAFSLQYVVQSVSRITDVRGAQSVVVLNFDCDAGCAALVLLSGMVVRQDSQVTSWQFRVLFVKSHNAPGQRFRKQTRIDSMVCPAANTISNRDNRVSNMRRILTLSVDLIIMWNNDGLGLEISARTIGCVEVSSCKLDKERN
jgi:hypothetical protein